MHQVRIEPEIPAFERAKAIHTLDSAATVIGIARYTDPKPEIREGGRMPNKSGLRKKHFLVVKGPQRAAERL
jgi:hypothetical protein